MAKKADRPTAANKIRKLLSRLFRHAIRTQQATHDPASAAELYKQNPDGPGTARQDLARLGRQNVIGERIAYTRGKTGVSPDLPIMAERRPSCGTSRATGCCS